MHDSVVRNPEAHLPSTLDLPRREKPHATTVIGRRWRHLAIVYSVALLATATAIIARWWMDPLLGEHLPFVTLFAATAVAVWIGGWPPAALAALLGYLASTYLFIDPRLAFGFNAERLSELFAYTLSSSVIILLGHAMRTARRRADESRELVRAVLAGIRDAVAMSDTAGRIAFMNETAMRLTGWSTRNAAGQPFESVFRLREEGPVPHDDARPERRTTLIAQDGTERMIDATLTPVHDTTGRTVGTVHVFRDVTERGAAEQERHALLSREHEARTEAETLNEIARALAAELDLKQIVQKATDAITTLIGANFGAFFENVGDARDDSSSLDTLSGAPADAFRDFGPLRNTPLFERTFQGTGIIRCDDLLQRPDYSTMMPDRYVPTGHSPLRSYLALPVVSRRGHVLGGLFFGHPDSGVFGARAERLAAGVAAQAAIAIDNAQLLARAEDSERRFRAMIDTLPAAVYTIDAEGRLTHFNPACVEIAGRTPQLGIDRWCIGWKLYDTDGTLLPPDTCLMAIALKERRAIRGAQVIIERPDGSRSWVMPYPCPLLDDHGRVTGGINMLVDITPLRQAEEALRTSEERYRAVIESQTEMVCRFQPDGAILFVNGAYALARGTTPDALIGINFWHFIAPSDQNDVRELLARLRPDAAEITIENRFQTNDGVRWTLWKNRALRFDAAGRAIEVQATGIDITDRKRFEEALRESESHLRLLANNLPALISYVDRDLRYRFNNRQYEEWFGIKADQLSGCAVRELLGDDFIAHSLPFLERAFGGESVRFEASIRHQKLGRRDVEMVYVPDVGAEGHVRGCYVMGFDISERKEAERKTRGFAVRLERLVEARTRELRASNRELEAFCYSVSHDLRAPLRTIKGFSQILRDQLNGVIDESTEALFARIEDATARSARLIDALLDLSRLARRELRTQRVDLTAVAHEIIDELRKIQPERAVTFHADADLIVDGDPDLLRLMLHNLLDNAWKFTSKKAQAVIRFGAADDQDSRRTFFVQDNGAGFDMAYIDKMFGVFQRLHGELEFPGTGIGLVTAQRIIERHGGEIRAEGRVGHGTTFYFSLDVAGAARANDRRA